MKKITPFLLIILFYGIYYITQNGNNIGLSFILFIPFQLSLEFKGFNIYKSIPIFIFGVIYFIINFGWLSNFYRLAPLFSGMLFSFIHFLIPYICLIIFRHKSKVNLYYILFFSSLWTVKEFIFQLFPMPFPYGSISLNLYLSNTLLQILDIVGQYGLTFLLILSNGLIFLILFNVYNKKYKQSFKYTLFTVLIILTWYSYGLISPKLLTKEKDIYIDLAQSNILGRDKANMDSKEYINYTQKFLQLKDTKSDLIIFPETFFYSDITDKDNPLNQYLQEWVQKNNINIAGGFIQENTEGKYTKSNSFFLMGSEGHLSISQKNLLAPFGEYYPLGSLFPQFKEFLQKRQGAYFFNRGNPEIKHQYEDRNGQSIIFRTLICYEAAFGSMLKGIGSDEIDFIVNISSDLWTRSSRALMQNAIYSKYRAIEYRLPIVRVSNGGLSGYINGRGKAWLPLPAFVEGNAHIWLVKQSHKIYKKNTPYSVLGDFIVYLSLCYILIFIIPFKRLSKLPARTHTNS